MTQAYADAARNRGARIMTHTAVHAIETADGRVTAVATSQGRLRADWVVNAAGAYAAEIGKMAGAMHDVRPWRGQLVVLEATESLPVVGVSGASQMLSKHAPAAADGAHGPLKAALYYCRRPFNGTVLLGSTYEFAGYDLRTSQEGVAGICLCVTRTMPRLRKLNAVRSWAGLRPHSPDRPDTWTRGRRRRLPGGDRARRRRHGAGANHRSVPCRDHRARRQLRFAGLSGRTQIGGGSVTAYFIRRLC